MDSEDEFGEYGDSDEPDVAEKMDSEVGELLGDLRLMINNPSFSDVVFVCNDGKRVDALRLFLAGRSDMLQGMLLSGLAESSSAEINLPTISSPVLFSVLEFLYTGVLSDYAPQSWTMAWEVISASQFLLLPNLERKVRTFLLHHISNVMEDLPGAAYLLTGAIESKTVFNETDVDLKRLVEILSSNLSDQSYVQNLSEDAFYYFLATSKGTYESDDELSFNEYLRFRQVIRWWIWRSHLCGEIEEHLYNITLDERTALEIYRDSTHIDSHDSTSVRKLSDESRNSAARLLSTIEFQRIHPALLAMVVEPLNILTSTEIAIAYRRHILSKPSKSLQLGLQSVVWNHGESYTTTSEGRYRITKTRTGTAFATLMVPMCRLHAIYKWTFYVDRMPSPFCQVGFTRKRKLCNMEGKKLSHQYSSKVVDCSEEKGTRIHLGNADGVHQWKHLGPSLLSHGSKLAFTFNAYEGTCSLSVNGKKSGTNYGVVWDQIPRGVTYYPGVCLGTSDEGRIRVQFVSGFDLR